MSEYIQKILNAFSLLDIGELRLNLKEEYSYANTTKEVFLNALEIILTRHKHAGDTKLNIYEGICIKKKSPDFGKKGYRFIGNNSKRYFDFIFETDGNDIKNIYHCKKFNPYVKIKKLSYKHLLKINDDEKNSFIKTPEYLAKLNAAEKAMSEIAVSPPITFSFNELSNWIDKHYYAFQLIGEDDPYSFPEMKWSDFVSNYFSLKEIRNYISNNIEQIRIANSSINDIETEKQLIDWLVKFEDIGETAPFNMKYSFHKKDDFYWWNFQNPICFKDEIFTDALNFIEFFVKQYRLMFEKHSTLTSEEISNILTLCIGDEYTKYTTSLKYHLNNREELEKKGFFVPHWINTGFNDN